MKIKRPPITADDLRKMGPEALENALGKLSKKELEELQFMWEFWARDDQLEPDGKWKIWLALAGRGWGKTRTGAEWVRHRVKCGDKRIAAVAPTRGSVRQVMVEGPAGLLNICSKHDKTYRGVEMGFPEWFPTNNTIKWSNGAKVEFFSAEDPERLRGPQFESAWCFTKGHMVETKFGQIPVERIQVGYKVQTSEGLREVSHTSIREMPVGKVIFDDGTTLEGTYDHPIYTQRGWVPLGELKESDTCLKLNTMDIFGVSTHKATTIQGAKELFIDMLQKRSSETSKALTYTTSTGTNSTITQTISNCSQGKNISVYTTVKGESLNTSQKVSVSSRAIVVEHSCYERKSLVKGLIAKLANIVGLRKKESSLQSVVTAERVSTPEWELFAVSVASTWQPTGRKIVYNLQVENTPEYFVNGILTHNCDEICAWGRLQETWDMLQFCMRLGKNPKIFISTTPKPVKLIRNLVKEHSNGGNRIFLTKGSSYDNADNIQLDALKEFEGTRLGQQELYGEILMEAEGALWNQTLLDECTDETITDTVKFAEDNLVRVVVAVDPATSDKVESDMTGIVVAGIDINGTGYVLEDATERYSPQKWAQKAVELYYKYGADRIVAEKNQGGDMVKQTLVNEDNTVPLRMVFASRNKNARAEPVSAMYERGKVKHAPGLGELEQQMVTWEPLGSMGSPDRLDACFVEGTPVLTDKGYTPIERVTTNHKVLTREGWKKVSWSGKTATKELTLDIGLSNGYTVTCTPEHPFYVQGQGWTRADELIEGVQLVTEQEVYKCVNTLQKSSSTVKLTVDTQTTQTSLNNAITFALAELDSRRSTEVFGNTTTDLFHKGTISTTLTGITSTTPQTTSSVYPQSNTQKNTEKSSTTCVSSKWTMQETLLRFGTVLRKGLSSISGWVKSLGKAENQTEIVLAKPVEIPSKPSLNPNTAQTSVTTKSTMTSIGPKWTVPYVETPFCRTNTDLNQKHAHVSVVQVCESKDVSDVYNLHVEECHEFLVSGVLVHNCVWALTDLMLKGRINPEMQILYKKD